MGENPQEGARDFMESEVAPGINKYWVEDAPPTSRHGFRIDINRVPWFNVSTATIFDPRSPG